ncbi:antibiotic biosynthesis monooxygenase family protein [Aurantiacibacter poecillastricola]|uniref:antibiotic biosynthesis monooxygenase family protein n=1 Tax=Aurantiacibacter poecillastricola TaxID=3064385 RepID=UPI00273DD543|nr:antibiotic biosynthesis monooxygenase [Aurantiacibacter sp. 219JJ12-13]MDP5260848.1 antibiotic biosynthesis monooxygenase [Aurantiacibacter sp. 219JJ12-13]
MYLVVFRNRKRASIDGEAYAEQAAAMEELASRQPGFLSFKSYEAADGEVIALSEWQDREAARRWGRLAEHRIAQADGRAHWYSEYTLFGCEDPRIHSFKFGDEQ